MVKNSTPVIGKFVLENLTTGMYKDSYCVYREYIQNSADAIDKAVSSKQLVEKDANIFIEVLKESRKITFHDNGTGISREKVADVLLNIAQSEKVIGKDKGFRGIGRLGGLGYCDKLVFETSFAGEETKSIITWDSKLLTEIIQDRDKKESAADVIDAVTTLDLSQYEESGMHYFNVIMYGVRKDELLEVADVEEYLKMVAPLPFDNGFIFRTKIKEDAAANGILFDEYNIFLNNDKLYKGYTTMIYDMNKGKKTKIGEIKDVYFFQQNDNKGKLLFWGWRSISDIQNAYLKPVNYSRGLRLRKNNIQIGDEYIFAELFPESRFALHIVGEVHALHPSLVPNGRRDDFEDSVLYNEFKNKLKPVCATIKKLSYDVSNIINAKRKIEDAKQAEADLELTRLKGLISDEQDEVEVKALETKKLIAEGAKKEIQKYEKIAAANTDEPLTKVFTILVPKDSEDKNSSSVAKIEKKVSDKPIYRVDGLSKLNKSERKIVSQVFEVVNKVLAKDLAENLIQKIEEKFK
ncbi:ATP-binding protein [Hymenobacter sp. YC55]|uniref:ATP-binding protein n=1 Tax=Hymenobacter sp. YC55 TaxID=3034019 RepID=UPI0023FA3FB6|nr:ATP-binding protein [Hymenobacter sp. YC55]MDF7812857.1 ATP-binding protein [Hymenobacter sp. YC55]